MSTQSSQLARQAAATSTTNELAAAERRARRFWVSLIVGLLGLQVMGGVVAIYLATSDPTVAVIPNYYQAGLDWDITKRNRDRFVTLGWNCKVQVQPHDPQSSHRAVVIQVRSKLSQPVVDLRVTGLVYHHARGQEQHSLTFDESNPGDYVAMIPLTQSGLWQVNLTLEGDHGIAEETIEVHVDPR